MENKLSKIEIVEIINQILTVEGTEEEEDLWLEQLSSSIPYYQEIYKIITTSKEDLTAEEILNMAEKNYRPINL